MDTVVWKVALQPLHTSAVSGEAVLTKQVFAQSHYISRIEKRLELSGNEVQLCSTLQTFFYRDLVEVTRLI